MGRGSFVSALQRQLTQFIINSSNTKNSQCAHTLMGGQQQREQRHHVPLVSPTHSQLRMSTSISTFFCTQFIRCSSLFWGLESTELQSITFHWLVPSYTAWRQEHRGVNNLPRVVTQPRSNRQPNPWPLDPTSHATVPPTCICIWKTYMPNDCRLHSQSQHQHIATTAADAMGDTICTVSQKITSDLWLVITLRHMNRF